MEHHGGLCVYHPLPIRFLSKHNGSGILKKMGKKGGEDIESEFMGIINYCIMGLIQIELKDSKT
jgi:hypothetical protein